MSHPENRAHSRKSVGCWLPVLLAGSLCLPLAAHSQINKDRTRPPESKPPPSTPPPAPHTSTPTPSPPARSSDSGSVPVRTPSTPPISSSGSSSPSRGGSGKSADFDKIFGGSRSSSDPDSSRTSHPNTAADTLNKANGGGRDTRTTSPRGGTTATEASQNGAAYDRFRRTKEGAIYSPAPTVEVFAPYIPYYGSYDGGYFPLPYPYPYPPGPYPPYPPDPSRREPPPDGGPDPNTGTNPDDYRIGEHNKQIDPLAEKAAQELRTAWLNGDIELLAKHIRRDIVIEIYADHQLQEKRDASDFLSDARYAFDTRTVAFKIESILPVSRIVYKVVARRTTRDAQGQEQTTTLRYLLERMNGVYIITRAETED